MRYLRERFFAARTIRDLERGNAELLVFLDEIANARPHPLMARAAGHRRARGGRGRVCSPCPIRSPRPTSCSPSPSTRPPSCTSTPTSTRHPRPTPARTAGARRQRHDWCGCSTVRWRSRGTTAAGDDTRRIEAAEHRPCGDHSEHKPAPPARPRGVTGSTPRSPASTSSSRRWVRSGPQRRLHGRQGSRTCSTSTASNIVGAAAREAIARGTHDSRRPRRRSARTSGAPPTGSSPSTSTSAPTSPTARSSLTTWTTTMPTDDLAEMLRSLGVRVSSAKPSSRSSPTPPPQRLSPMQTFEERLAPSPARSAITETSPLAPRPQPSRRTSRPSTDST